MAEEGGKRDARSLVSAILASTPPAAAPETARADADAGDAQPSVAAVEQASPTGVGEQPAAGAEAAGADDAEAAELIEVYFDLEEPAERDVLFDQIVQVHSPVVNEFLRVMMQEDEDELIRAAAAAELARRGVPEAVEVLESDLDDPEEMFFFEQAVLVLSELRGPAFYDRLASIWRDPERDADQRREAMVGMESCDPTRAMIDLVAAIEAMTDVGAMPDDQVEAAMMAFLRHDYAAAIEPLARLRDRIAAHDMDPEERRELMELVQEGIDLLSASPAGEAVPTG